MNVVKKQRSQRRAGYIISQLLALDVPRSLLYRHRRNGSFWRRDINHLAVLERAHQLYRAKIVQAHPDKEGGSHDQSIQLNSVWNMIKKKFKLHGHTLALGVLLISLTGCHVLNPNGEKHKLDIPDSWRYQGEPDARLDRLPEARMLSTVEMQVSAPAAVPVNSVTLVFDPSPDSTVTGYAIYWWAGNITNTVDLGLELIGRIDDLVSGVTNHFAAVAYNQIGERSKFSNVVQYTVPDFSNRSVTIILLSAPSALGPWTPRLTNSIPAMSGMEAFKQIIQKDL